MEKNQSLVTSTSTIHSSGHFFLNGLGNRIDVLQNQFGGGGVRNLQLESFVEGDNELQRVHGIETEAAGTEQRLVIADFSRRDLKHEVFDHQCFDFFFQCARVFHAIKRFHRPLSKSNR